LTPGRSSLVAQEVAVSPSGLTRAVARLAAALGAGVAFGYFIAKFWLEGSS